MIVFIKFFFQKTDSWFRLYSVQALLLHVFSHQCQKRPYDFTGLNQLQLVWIWFPHFFWLSALWLTFSLNNWNKVNSILTYNLVTFISRDKCKKKKIRFAIHVQAEALNEQMLELSNKAARPRNEFVLTLLSEWFIAVKHMQSFPLHSSYEIR